ncbi:MAG: PadR family transcriptional regulator [Muribaculaceae bacterium]|nr:PadR family transcriptional regulator [Muribaculaceae bacterium]
MNIEEKIGNIKSQMRKGMLEYCILLVLKDERKYTSDIIDIMKRSGLVVVEGTLYTLLNRLRKEGKLTYEWEESPKGPPRKYYRLTEEGEVILQYMSEAWDEIAGTIDSLRNTDIVSNRFNLEKEDENNI